MENGNKIKLIIVDYHGVFQYGNYWDICNWLAKKYKLNSKRLYEVFYHKYFCQAARREISELDSFALAAKELNLKETGKELREKHIGFFKLNKRVFNLLLNLQKEGYEILFLSKNTSEQFDIGLKMFKVRKYFKNIINTFDLRIEKASPKTMKFVLKKFKVKPTEVVFIDDQDFNLVAPKKMGIKTILYKNYAQFRKELNKFI